MPKTETKEAVADSNEIVGNAPNGATISLSMLEEISGGAVSETQSEEKAYHPQVPTKEVKKGSLTEKNLKGATKMIETYKANVERVSEIIKEVSKGKKDDYDAQQLYLATLNSAFVAVLPAFENLLKAYKEANKG